MSERSLYAAAHILTDANRLYQQGGTRLTRALSLVDNNGTFIWSAWERAFRARNRSVHAARLCSEFALANYIVYLRIAPPKLFWLVRGALESAERVGDIEAAACHAGVLALCHLNRGDPTRALELYRRKEALAKELRNVRCEVEALGGVALAKLRIGDAVASLSELRRALKKCTCSRQSWRSWQLSLVYGGMGDCYFATGDWAAASTCYGKAKTFAESCGNTVHLGSVLNNLGLVSVQSGRYQAGIRFARRALRLAKKAQNRRGQGMALGCLGDCYRGLRKYARAAEFYGKWLEIAREQGDKASVARCSGNLGEVLCSAGHVDIARPLLDFRWRYLRSIGHPLWMDFRRGMKRIKATPFPAETTRPVSPSNLRACESRPKR